MRWNLDLDKGSFRKELDRFFPDLDDRVLDASKGMWLDIQDRLSRFKDSVSNLDQFSLSSSNTRGPIGSRGPPCRVARYVFASDTAASHLAS